MRTLSTLALSALALVSLSAATVNRSAPISQDVCDALPVPFAVPSDAATDNDINDFLLIRSESYCSESGKGTAWCACFNAGLIRD